MNQFAGNTVIASLKEHGASRFPLPAILLLLLDRERKRFLAFARNDDRGKKGTLLSPLSPYGEGGDGRHSPSFRWKEVLRRGGGWLPQRGERKCEGSGVLVFQTILISLADCVFACQ